MRASKRLWQTWTSAVLLATVLAGCTSFSNSVAPSQILSPAPKPTIGSPAGDCDIGIIRADRIPAERLPGEMEGHIPFWLPPGFGLMLAWEAERESSLGEPGPGAIWADAGCRLIILRIYPGELEPVGKPRVGPWVVTTDYECSFTPVGEQRCVDYRTNLAEEHLSLWTFALTPKEAERVLGSVILE